tara:strand:+ start:1659 stop:2591 length:933 start_codon:yes stop_codon:yes gene_type:complete
MFKKENIVISLLAFLFILSIFVATTNKKNTSLSSTENSTKPIPFTGNKNGIAVIELYGPIAFSDTSNVLFPNGADLILKQIKLIEEDKNVKGILLKINSPGGTVGASQEIHSALLNCKEKRKFPIVAQIGDVGASGAYYVALAADQIFANPGSLVGSIGVILGNLNVKELANDNGVYQQIYKGGKYKDILSMWRTATTEEENLLINLVKNVHEQFKSDLINSRNINNNDLKKVAEGQIFTGTLAIDLNLIDQLGSFQDAAKYIGNETGLGDNPNLISKTKSAFYDVASIFTMSLKNSFFKNDINNYKLMY